MSPHYSGEWQFLFSTILVVAFRAFSFKRLFWNVPLNHGPQFFLGVEVSPGFYEGEGAGWLRRYHAALLIELLVEALSLPAVVILARRLLMPWWVLLPFWAGCSPVVEFATCWGFGAYTRATLGARPPVRPNFAVPLEVRRLGEYISWPREVLIAVITAASWAVLLVNHHGRSGWQAPVLLTYVVVGLLPFKIDVVRRHVPIPADRPAEHFHWLDAQRRLFLDGLDLLRWMFLFLLADHVLLHSWHGWRLAGPGAWLRWSVVGVVWVIASFFALALVREQRRVESMGRSLRPPSSWATPFRPARPMMGLTPWSTAWFGGLVLLLVFFRY